MEEYSIKRSSDEMKILQYVNRYCDFSIIGKWKFGNINHRRWFWDVCDVFVKDKVHLHYYSATNIMVKHLFQIEKPRFKSNWSQR